MAEEETVNTGDEGAESDAVGYESQARARGWLPQEEYHDDSKPWVDAKTFVERGKRFNNNLIKEVDQLKRKLQEFEGTREAFKKFHADTIKQKDTELAEALSELRVKRSQAIQDGEHEQAVALEDRIEVVKTSREELKAELKQQEKSAEAPSNPILDEWIADGNEWFRDDPKLRAYAVEVGRELRANGDTATDRAFLERVKKLVEADFPAKFNGGRRPSGVDGGDRGTGSAGKSEKDLPEADRALMQRFVREGWTTKEDFLKSYFSR